MRLRLLLAFPCRWSVQTTGETRRRRSNWLLQNVGAGLLLVRKQLRSTTTMQKPFYGLTRWLLGRRFSTAKKSRSSENGARTRSLAGLSLIAARPLWRHEENESEHEHLFCSPVFVGICRRTSAFRSAWIHFAAHRFRWE